MYHDDEDLHMCISCHATIAGLENYISHRNAGPCKSQHSVKRTEAPIPVLSPLEISKSERIRPISSTTSAPNGENLNFLNADFFFSSLELQSRRKDGVFEEVMGIEEVLDEDYEVRDNGGQRTVYSSGGKWGYEDYTTERDLWGGGSKGGEGLDGGDFHEDDVDLHAKSETFKEKNKKKKDKNLSVCETDENPATFDESLSTDVDYVMRNTSPTKSGMMTSPIKTAHPHIPHPEDVCLSDATKESVIGEFGITLDSCNLVMDSLNSKEDEERYKNASIPPSGHTRGKWIPGSASEGIRKSGNAVEYFCKPCNKNIRNRRSYEAHLSTSCHLKKLMKNSGGQGCITTSEGPRLRSRRILLSKPDPKSEKTKENKSVKEESRSQEDEQKDSISDSQSYLMNSLGVKRKASEDQIPEDCLENVPLSSRLDLLEKIDNDLPISDDKNNGDASSGISNPRKRKYNRIILKRSCKSNSACDGNEQVIDNHMMKKRMHPEVCEETLPNVNNLHASDEHSPLNLKECNNSAMITRSPGIELPSRKSGNTSLVDIVSFRHPVVNLGYRCDSEEFHLEREKLKTLVNIRHCNSPHQSSVKSLQDEMLFGLELMRTESNIPGSLIIRNSEIKESTLKEIDHQMPEKIDEINGDKSGSNFKLSESDASCHIVGGHDAHHYEEAISEDVSDGSIKSREEVFVIRSETRVLCNDSADNTVRSKSSIPHIHAESVNINEAGSDAARKEGVSSLSDKTSIATQTAIEDALHPENPENSSRNLKEDVGATCLHNLNDISESQKVNRPINEIEYYVVIKSSFDDNFKSSQIVLENAKETDKLAPINEVTPKNIPVLYPDVPTRSNADETTENQSGKNVVVIVNSVEKRSEGTLEGPLTENNEIRSLEDLRRQQIKEQSPSVAFVGSREQKSHDDKNAGIGVAGESTCVLNDFETSTQQLNQISQEKEINKSQVVIPVNLPGNELSEEKDLSFRTSKENFNCEEKESELRANSYDGKEKDSNLPPGEGEYMGNFSFEQNIPGSTQFPGLLNRFSFPVQSNLSQTLNLFVQVSSVLDNNAQLLRTYQNAVSEPLVEAPVNKPEIDCKGPNLGEKNSVPSKRYRPLLPKLSTLEPPKNFGTVDVNISSNTPFPCGPMVIGGIPAEIPLIVGNGMALNQSSFQIGSTVGVPSAPICNNSASSGVIESNEEDVLSLLPERNNTEVSPDKKREDLETVNSNGRPTYRIPIEIQRVENEESSKDLKSGREEGTCTDPVKYVCGLCGYQSRRFWCVDRHIAQHLPRKKQYPCEVCDMQFFSMDALKQHSKRHEPKKWECNIPGCHQAFATKNEWFVHVEGRHSTERTHKCTLCDYSGKTSLALERHMKKHRDNDRNVECSVCFKVVKKECLERHKKIHDSEEFYVCPHCDFKTTFLSNLRRHIKQSDSHPGKKLYSCPFCISDRMPKDKGTCSLKEQSNTISANSACEMLEHINTKHPEEKDFSFKYHNAGELLRRLLAFLGIHNPRCEVFEKNRNEDSPEKYSSVGDSEERMYEGGEEMHLDGDADSNTSIRNGYPAETSAVSIFQKPSCAKDLQLTEKVNESTHERSIQIGREMISDGMPSNLEENWVNDSDKNHGTVVNQSWVNDSDKNHGTVDPSQDFNADIGMEHLVKEKNSESLSPQKIRALNPTTHSSVLCTGTKRKASMGDDVENPPPQAINDAKASEVNFSDSEMEPQICCISNVFTMAESDVDAEFSSRENAILKDTNSCSDNVETSTVTFYGDHDNLGCISMKKEAEVEVVDVEEDEVSLRNIKETVLRDKTLALCRNINKVNADQMKTIGPPMSNGQNTNLRCDVVSVSHDLLEQKTDSPTKQKRKVPRWSSVVEIIEKRDGVISLWPTSP